MGSTVPDHNPEIEKWCGGCEKIVPLTGFHKDKTHSDGYKSRCKVCRSGKKKRKDSSLTSEYQGKTRQELETLARSKAIKRCIENNWQEFQDLLTRYRGEVGLPREWHEIST